MSGMATAPNFMEDIRRELSLQLMQEGWDVASQLVFPYGDWSRRTAPQIMEIAHDMRLGPYRFARSIGGRRAAEAIRNDLPSSKDIRVFIGHSGRGIAAAHASRILHQQLDKMADDDDPGHFIIQIGSPRSVVVPEDRQRTLYLSSGAHGRQKDLVTRMGTWGGWERSVRGWWRWNPDKYAPADRVQLPLLGGHADYFRRHEPFVSGTGGSNLEKVTDCILMWLTARIKPFLEEF